MYIPVFGNSARIVQTTAPEQDSPMREVPVRITSPSSPNFYLVAAEAAVEGAATQAGKSARDLVNVLRARAGRWTYSNAEYKEVDRDFSAEMTAATPTTIDINYILDERSREFYGEGYRWFDLVRTQKWNEYADSYVICGGKGDHNPQTYSRTIEAFHYLRPIPQGQLDGMEMTEEEKDAYQNPGYRD